MKYKKIINPTRYYNDGVTKTSMLVPDYNCAHARLNRKSDLELRLHSEITRYTESGGKVIFITLTYNDFNLPWYTDVDEETGEVFRFKCFDKKHIDYFTHAIADDLRRNCHYNGDKSRADQVLPFRYYIGSEYGYGDEYISDKGEKRIGTERPHYHALLFFPKEVADQYTESKFMQLFRRYWKFGFIRWSKDPDTGKIKLYVTNEFAAEYTSKYGVKDLNFFFNPSVDKYINPNGIKDEVRYKKVKPFLPRAFSSQHIGEALKEKFVTYEDFRDGVSESKLGYQDQSKGIDVKRKCPLYIQRKTLLYYDYSEERYKHTAKGLQYKTQMFIDRLEKKAQQLQYDISPIGLLKKLSKDEILQHQNELLDFKSHQEISDHITSILINESVVKRFIIYNQVYSGLRLPTDTSFWYENNRIKNLSDKDFLFQSALLYSQQLDNSIYDTFVSEGYFHLFKDSLCTARYYNELPVFSKFDDISNFINIIDDIYRVSCQKAYEEDRRMRKIHKLKVS